MGEIIEKAMVVLITSFVGLIVLILGFTTVDSIFGISCQSKYENTTYSFFGGCKVEYEGNYIPEKKKKKAFEQNIKLTK